MKKVFKITIILILAILMQMQFNFVYAVGEGTGHFAEEYGSTAGGGEDWSGGSESFWNPISADDSEELASKANIIATIIRNVGIVVSVIALMIIGIRTMTASVEEKAVYKQALPGYILGVIMVIAISVIPTIIFNVVKKW